MKIMDMWIRGIYGVQDNGGEYSVVDHSAKGSVQFVVKVTELVCLDYRGSDYG